MESYLYQTQKRFLFLTDTFQKKMSFQNDLLFQQYYPINVSRILLWIKLTCVNNMKYHDIYLQSDLCSSRHHSILFSPKTSQDGAPSQYEFVSNLVLFPDDVSAVVQHFGHNIGYGYQSTKK